MEQHRIMAIPADLVYALASEQMDHVNAIRNDQNESINMGDLYHVTKKSLKY